MESTITVSGEGIAKFSPDTAIIRVTVRNTDDWGSSAIARTANEISNIKEKLLKEQAILPENIVTTPMKLSSEGSDTSQGENAEQSILIIIKKMDRIGPVFSTLSSISGISISDPVLKREQDEMKAEDEARTKAVLNARHKAETIAKAAGFKALRIKSITEGECEKGFDENEEEKCLFVKAAVTAVFAAEQ